MSSYIRAFMPNRISGQIALIIVASLVIIHLVLTTAFFLSRPEHHEYPPDQIATLVEVLDASASDLRPQLIRGMASAFPQLEIALAAPNAANNDVDGDRLLDSLRHRLGPRFRVGRLAASGATPLVAIGLRDGQVVSARMPLAPAPLLGPAVFTLLFIAVSVTLLGFWAGTGLTKPLRGFARAAENFSPGGEVALLPERGPYEIRAAARALNQMRARVKALIDDRTRMLVAVSHDLRTPITRLRLRCEFIENQALRAPALDDLDHMNAMVESVLNFLRDERSRAHRVAIDLAASLQTICDQFSDMGHEVAYEGPDHVVVSAIQEDLHRAITNLVDNAVRYGGQVLMRLTREGSAVVIAVEDDGPGIAGDKDDMLQPFARGDAARRVNGGGGFGLGLSIARAVVEAHGGTLELLDRAPSGLVARITLPVEASAAAKSMVNVVGAGG
jgi:signal transduction histidine kinase